MNEHTLIRHEAVDAMGSIAGLAKPLDFTLKAGMRVVSSSSVNWFHRLMNCRTFDANIDTKTLYSWVHPQCSLPNLVITALTSSMKEEGRTNGFLEQTPIGMGDIIP